MRKFIKNLLVGLFKSTKKRSIRNILFKCILILDDYRKQTARSILKEYYKITVGRYSYGCFKIDETIEPGTIVGSFCSIAPGVSLGGMNHPINFVSSHPFLYDNRYGYITKKNEEVLRNGTVPVIIEDDVWIGRNAIVLPGVTIKKGAVVAAGAVVTKDVEPYVIVGGIPAKEIKKRFTDEQINKLLSIDWTNWDDEKIKSNIESFYDVNRLIKS